MKPRLHHAALSIRFGGIEKARDFYTAHLGLEELDREERPAGSLWFGLAEDAQLHLFEDIEKDAHSPAHVCLEINDYDRRIRRLADDGYAVTEPDMRLNARRVFVRDPFGNRLELRPY